MWVAYFKVSLLAAYSNILLPTILKNMNTVMSEQEIANLLLYVAITILILSLAGALKLFGITTSIIAVVLSDIAFLSVLMSNNLLHIIIAYYVVFRVVGEVFLSVIKSFATSTVTKYISASKFAIYKLRLVFLGSSGAILGLLTTKVEFVNVVLLTNVIILLMIILNILTFYFIQKDLKEMNEEIKMD